MFARRFLLADLYTRFSSRGAGKKNKRNIGFDFPFKISPLQLTVSALCTWYIICPRCVSIAHQRQKQKTNAKREKKTCRIITHRNKYHFRCLNGIVCREPYPEAECLARIYRALCACRHQKQARRRDKMMCDTNDKQRHESGRGAWGEEEETTKIRGVGGGGGPSTQQPLVMYRYSVLEEYSSVGVV